MSRKEILALAVVAAMGVAPACADVWDTATDTDNDSSTENELVHGTHQTHDLGVQPGPMADEDWYRITVPGQSSFEIVMDSTTGDLNFIANDTSLDRLDSTGSTVLQSHSCLGTGCFSKTLRWTNVSALDQVNLIRIRGQGCGISCTTSAQYQIRGRDTTVRVARFNNSSSQITVLISQNTTNQPISGNFFYWDPAGVLLVIGALLNFSPFATDVFNTTNSPTLQGQSGSITVAHDGPYGAFNIKAVALEPATGFTFDTPGTHRPN